jgi:acrylyl-CoA reductase (NADPH)
MVAAFVAERSGAVVQVALTELSEEELGDGDVVIRTEWSSANYKDALTTRPDGGVARLDRLVPGVDLAGTVLESTADVFHPGDLVLVHGYGLGVSHHGGFAARARVPHEWIVPLPAPLTAREAMIFGTAGFTAALSIHRIERQGIGPEDGPVLVTGATGGVGSFAVAMLARRGYEVIASSGKAEATPWLEALGATRVIGREDLSRDGRPLERQLYAAAVDSVGGATLAGVLRSMRWGGAVVASGVTGGAVLQTTVFPFILRAVALLGIDTTALPMGERTTIWGRMAGELRPVDLERFVAGEVDLAGLPGVLDALLAGKVRGRYLVRPTAGT